MSKRYPKYIRSMNNPTWMTTDSLVLLDLRVRTSAPLFSPLLQLLFSFFLISIWFYDLVSDEQLTHPPTVCSCNWSFSLSIYLHFVDTNEWWLFLDPFCLLALLNKNVVAFSQIPNSRFCQGHSSSSQRHQKRHIVIRASCPRYTQNKAPSLSKLPKIQFVIRRTCTTWLCGKRSMHVSWSITCSMRWLND